VIFHSYVSLPEGSSQSINHGNFSCFRLMLSHKKSHQKKKMQTMKANGFYEPVGFSVTLFFQCLDSEYMGVSWGILNSWMIFKLGVPPWLRKLHILGLHLQFYGFGYLGKAWSQPVPEACPFLMGIIKTNARVVETALFVLNLPSTQQLRAAVTRVLFFRLPFLRSVTRG